MPALSYYVTHCIRHSCLYCTANGWLQDQEQFFYDGIRELENAGPSTFQLQATMLKSDKIWHAYLVVNCVSLRTFWTPLVCCLTVLSNIFLKASLSLLTSSFNKPPPEKKHAWISVVEWTMNMSSRSSLAPSMPLLNGYNNTRTQNFKLTISNYTVGGHSAGLKLSVLFKYLLKQSQANYALWVVSDQLTHFTHLAMTYGTCIANGLFYFLYTYFTYLLFLTSSFRDGKHCDIFENIKNIKNSEKIIFDIYRAFAYTLQKI